MDKYNCIEPSTDINKLDLELNQWQRLPYDQRKISDGYCVRQYGCTNIDLYNTIKSMILTSDESEDMTPIRLESTLLHNKAIYRKYNSLLEAVNINITTDNGEKLSVVNTDTKDVKNAIAQLEFPKGYTADGSINPNIEKVEKTKSIMNQDSNIIIIPDFIDDKHPDYNKTDLEKNYNDYLTLTPDYKQRSDTYSIQIWNRTVPFMYEYMKSKFGKIETSENDNGLHHSVSPQFQATTSDKELRNYEDTMKDTAKEGDQITNTIQRIDCLIHNESRTVYEMAVLENFFDTIQIKQKTYQQGMPEVLPFLTYDEYVNNPDCLDYSMMDRVDPFTYVLNYKDNQTKTISDLKEAYRKHDNETLLKMGWNPYVEPIAENFKYARDKQIKWFNEYFSINFIDLSDYDTKLTEETLDKSLFNMDPNQILQPIYITTILQRTDVYGSIETSYSNPGIAFDTDLVDIFTFNDDGTISRENIHEYAGLSEDTEFGLFVCFVNENLKDIIYKGILRVFQTKEHIYDYKHFNTINTNPQFVIGQFLDQIFRLIGMKFDSSSAFSKDIIDIKRSNVKSNIFMIYKGKQDSYYARSMKLKVKNLISKNGYNSLTMFKPDFAIDKLSVRLLENFNIKTDDERINNLLAELREAVKPKDMFNSLPIVNTANSIYNDYLNTHAQLHNTPENNIDGIKRAVEHMYGLRSKAEVKALLAKENNIELDDKIKTVFIESTKDCYMYRRFLNE